MISRRRTAGGSVEIISQLRAFLLFAVVATPALGASIDHPITRARFLMGTTCEVTLPPGSGDEAFDTAFDEIDRIEDLISTWRPESALSRINRQAVGESIPAGAEIFDLLAEAIEWSVATDRAFSPFVAPLVDAWDLRHDGRIPDETEIRAALERTNPAHFVLDLPSRTITRLADIRVEEGAFGKGFAIDRALARLSSLGVKSTSINFGGQIAVLGPAPIEIAIAHPEHRDEAAVALDLSAGSISTTSGSERTFVVDGQRFSHIVDPRTGRAIAPRDSVSVVHDDAFVADILSTALNVMGPSEGLAWANRHEVAAIFLIPEPESRGRWQILLSDPATRRNLRIRPIDTQFKIKERSP